LCHIRTHTKEKPFQCEHCQKCFVDRSFLVRHIRTHTREKRFQCEHCQKCFADRSSLVYHIRTHTKEKPFQCEHCHKCFTQYASLVCHVRTHTKEKPFQCEHCQKCFADRSGLVYHIRTHTNEKPFQCEHCQKCFAKPGNLKQHIRTHTKEKPFQCEHCQKCFTQYASLVCHIRTHTKEKPFQCEHCQKCFADRSGLVYHIRTHTKEKPFQCEHCQKCFAKSGNLKQHIRTHTKEKPFQCEHCQKCFTRKASLLYHIRTHTKEKPFQCEHCQKCFADRSVLVRHIRTHTREKPFQCEQCQKCFAQKPPLVNHIRTHTKEKPFQCEHCQKCFARNSSLLRHIKTHTKYCGHINDVASSKSHLNNSRKVYDVNTKAALGMLHAGMGPTQVNNFLTTMNLPHVYENLLKRREREVGPHVEIAAKRACQEATKEETADMEEQGGVVASYDMGWQKRGRAHNSLTGHGVMIGSKTQKIIGYATKNKWCKQCHHDNQNKNSPPKDHDCRMNWHKSSKAMEPDVALTIGKELQQQGAELSHIVGDEDASTIKQLREGLNPNIKKVSDVIHSKRSLASHLYDIKKTKSEVTEGVIHHILKCYSYAINQNKGNAEGIQRNLQAIIPHCYGEHIKCGTWCRYLQDPTNYRHKALPGGKPLQDTDTRAELERIMDMQVKNADNLAPVLNSQANECFNATVASKAPKSRHYGGSESNDYRVAAAVCQKNLGNVYVSEDNKNKNLSPGTFTLKHAIFSNTVRQRSTTRSKDRNTKLRRKQLQQDRLRATSTFEVREGVTYKKDCGYDLDNIDTEEIPAPVRQPEMRAITADQVSDDRVILFDLETTCTGSNAEITQIAAMKGDQRFNKYVLPTGNISTIASDITGLSVETTMQGSRILVHNGRRVAAEPIHSVLTEFISWLRSIQGANMTIGSKVILCGHNVRVFDMRVIVSEAERCHLTQDLQTVVGGFMDTLPSFRQFLTGRESYSQTNLYRDIVKKEYEAHDAAEDVIALEELLTVSGIPLDVLAQHTVTFHTAVERIRYLNEKNARLKTLKGRLSTLSCNMLNKIAGSGLQYSHLKLAFRRGGETALKQLLSEPIAGTRSCVNTIVDMAMKHLKPFSCAFCQLEHYSLDKLKTHVNRHLIKYVQARRYKSMFCQKSLSNSGELKRHVNNHLKLWCQCNNCLNIKETQKCFGENSVLGYHIRTNTKEKLLQCEHCEKCFAYRSVLVSHMRTHTKEKPFQCDYCKKCFALKGGLVHHIRTHTKEKPYQCEYCQKYFTHNYTLKRHIRTHTKEKPYQCEYCQKYFSDNCTLKRHIRTHTKEKQYQCEYCQKYFSDNYTLKRHIRSHTKEKPFQCDHCQKCFTQNTSLVSHIRTHTKEKPLHCEHCQKSFAHRSGLVYHIRRTHTKEKPFQCEHCQKCFAKSGILKQHIRTHTKEKPFQCEHCQKCFTQKASLMYHIRTHTNEKPFQCEHCQKCFADRSFLVHHIRTHTREKSFQCEHCQKCFKQSYPCESHQNSYQRETFSV
ncbi:uncharacterized protein, partial [Amphiura filiformis]|uniref:uncharacterized protein n=1 Tax=Amphiura filiformis TaxID=82378 RepID=UPI003B215BFB